MLSLRCLVASFLVCTRKELARPQYYIEGITFLVGVCNSQRWKTIWRFHYVERALKTPLLSRSLKDLENVPGFCNLLHDVWHTFGVIRKNQEQPGALSHPFQHLRSSCDAGRNRSGQRPPLLS